jgi:hypothetical protein
MSVFGRRSDIWAASSDFGTLSTIVSVLSRRPCLQCSNHGANTDVHLAGDSLDGKPGFTKPHDFIGRSFFSRNGLAA